MTWRRRYLTSEDEAFVGEVAAFLADPDTLSRAEVDELATYNAERSRGIVHTPEWQHSMAERQQRFDAVRARQGDGGPS